jgi:hypothetical protein
VGASAALGEVSGLAEGLVEGELVEGSH